MGLGVEHTQAIQSGQFAVVRAFVEAHPEELNPVRSRIKHCWKEKEEEEEERNSP